MKTHTPPVWAILPVKSFRNAKQRLRTALTPNERRKLVHNSLWDVLTALGQSSRLAGILMVSRDPDALAMAREFGVRPLIMDTDTGQSDAIDRAVQFLRSEGVTATMTIPGDTPLVMAEDIDSVCNTLGKAPAVTIVPNMDGTGSNCIGASPPDLIPYQFGDNSFAKHLSCAHKACVEPRILELPRLELDIDTTGDIARLMDYEPRTATQKYLLESGILERCMTVKPEALLPVARQPDVPLGAR